MKHPSNETTTSERSASQLAEGLKRWRDETKQHSTDKSVSKTQENFRQSDGAFQQACVC